MNTAEIEVPRDVALQHFRDYRNALRQRFTKEDEALMRGYQALSKGRRLLDLHESFRIAGLDELKRPRLSIARCDWQYVYFRRDYSNENSLSFTHSQNPHHNSHRIRLPESVYSAEIPRGGRLLRSVVPAIPPKFRPPHSLAGYHILWEPVWESVPSDPILLKHLQGALYVALAQWDLTPLEQAVLRGRKVV